MLDTSTVSRWLVDHFSERAFFAYSFFFFFEYPVSGVASVSDFLMRHDAMVIYFLTFSDFALLLLVGSFSYSDLYIKANYLFCILYDIELRIYFI